MELGSRGGGGRGTSSQRAQRPPIMFLVNVLFRIVLDSQKN